ncbi:hypothetical protein [Desertimonas flava]|uniref:hypothetical protein n=1 Tax=Desertimonas flava TaxID=2064846 RepID=UPI000E344EA7|nr:hypothetical protein [Desertimonas flava]
MVGGAAAAPPDPVGEFVAWAAASGQTLTSVACSADAPPVCYGLDPEFNTVAATRNDDGSFTVVAPMATAPALATAAPVDPSSGVGTRANPVPIGTPADIGDGWTLVVNSVNLDGTAAVTGENMFNDPPPEGSVYVLINITATYNGTEEKAMPMFWVSGVTSANVEIDGLDSFVMPPDAFDSLGEVFAGGSASGNVVLPVPSAELPTLVLYTSAGFMGDDVYFASA